MSVAASDPHGTTLVAALAGSALYVMSNYSAVLGAPKKATPEERAEATKKLIFDSAAAVAAAAIGGWYVAAAIVNARRIVDPEGRGLVGLVTGSVFWPGIPWAIKEVLRRVRVASRAIT